jgi:hypothetical protein
MKGFVNKIKWIGATMLVFLMVLATNLIDHRNYSQIKNSVFSIYEDRLQVKDWLFDVHHIMDHKKYALISNDTTYFESKQNIDLNDTLESNLNLVYETKLSSGEKKVLDDLLNDIEQYFVLEQHDSIQELFEQDKKNKLVEKIQIINAKLNTLSKIQVDEGKAQLLKATSSMDAIDNYTRIEIVLLIIIGVVIQAMLIYSSISKNED